MDVELERALQREAQIREETRRAQDREQPAADPGEPEQSSGSRRPPESGLLGTVMDVQG